MPGCSDDDWWMSGWIPKYSIIAALLRVTSLSSVPRFTRKEPTSVWYSLASVDPRLAWVRVEVELTRSLMMPSAVRGILRQEATWLCSCICKALVAVLASSVDCCRFFRRVASFSSRAAFTFAPSKNRLRKPRSLLIGIGPLMCPWAFSTQTESHRRPHTDNGAARHGFWKVTLRIAWKKKN